MRNLLLLGPCKNPEYLAYTPLRKIEESRFFAKREEGRGRKDGKERKERKLGKKDSERKRREEKEKRLKDEMNVEEERVKRVEEEGAITTSQEFADPIMVPMDYAFPLSPLGNEYLWEDTEMEWREGEGEEGTGMNYDDIYQYLSFSSEKE